MSIQRVALIFDNTARPETTGLYCRRALGCLVEVEHFLPTELSEIPRDRFDLFLRVDDGLKYSIPETLRPLAFWAIDTHVDLDGAVQKAQRADIALAAQRNGAEQLTAAGIEASWLPLACDPVVHRPYDVPQQQDVCFVGNVLPGVRADLLERVRQAYPDMLVGRRYFEQMAQTYCGSRIVFNRSVADDVNMRVFETLGCGRLLLTNDLAGSGQEELLQDGIHLATYTSAEDLLDKLAYYLRNDELRERIGRQGRAEVLLQHTYLHRMSTLLQTVERRLAKTSVSVPAAGIGDDSDGSGERQVSACLVSWKRPDNVRQIVARLLNEPLIDDIIVWNNNPGLTLTFADPRVTVIQSERNRVTYGRYLAARQARHEVIYTQDDDCLVHNLAELYETFRLDGTRIVHGLKLGHLIDNPRNLFGTAQMALVGWGALFGREWFSVFETYIAQHGEDDLLDRKADRIFSVLLNRRHRSVPASVTDLAGTDGPEALSVRDDHMQLTAAAIERCLPLLRGKLTGGSTEQTDHGRNGRGGTDRQKVLPEREAQPERRVDQWSNDPAASGHFRGSDSTRTASGAKEAGYFEFDRPDVLELVPESAVRILDIGCGAGRLGAAIKDRQQAEVVGIELDPWAAEAAAGRLDEVQFGNVESDAIDFPAERFDCVICADILEHLRHPEAVLQKIGRWLQPNGCLATSIPNVRNHTVLRSLLAGNWTYESAGLLDEDHVRFFTRREIEKLLFRAGFDVDEVRLVPGEGYDQWAAAGNPSEVNIGGLHVRTRTPEEAGEFYAYQYLMRSKPAPAVRGGLTSIIIVTHNQLTYTRLCVDSILIRTDEPYELIFVDNGSTDETPAYLQSLENATVIENDSNRGFPAAVNQGLAVARGEQILLLNNDTVVTTGWLRRMLEILHSADDIGLVGPVSNSVSGPQRIEAHYTHLNELDGFAWTRHGRFGPAAAGRDVMTETDRLVGFCLLIKRQLLDDIGTLDEQFGIGCFEDDDLCRRALEQGYRAVIAQSAFVHHFGSVTFQATGIDFARLMQENHRRYEQKWRAPASTNGHQAIDENAASEGNRSRFLVQADDSGALRLKSTTATITLCMIVRDNEGTIRPCLESIRPWVEEMVIVDTGSTDATPEICKELGARLFHWPWRDDFAAARNESLKPARGEWIFWMDSDDTIPEECGRKLRELVDGAHDEHVLGYTMQVQCPGADAANVTVVDHVKLFRNRPDLRFEFRIHEQILPAIRRAGGEVAWTDLYVVHSGSDHSPEGRQRKLERDFRLLELELRDRPDHPFVLFNLGMTHTDASQHEEAIEYLRRCIEVSQSGESHLRKAYALLVNSLSQCGQADDAWDVCQQGLELFGGDKELLFRRAMLEHRLGRLRDAEQTYLRVLNEQTDRHFASIDCGLSGYKARHNLAVIYEEMGCLGKAEAEWREIVQQQPTYYPAWLGLAALLIQRDEVEEAVGLANQLQQTQGMQAYGQWIAAKVAAHQGAYAEACEGMEQVVREIEENLEAHNGWCHLLFEHGDPAKAATALKELIAKNPQDASAHHNLGAIYERLGANGLAIESYKNSLELRPGYAPTERQLARLRLHSGHQGHADPNVALPNEEPTELAV